MKSTNVFEKHGPKLTREAIIRSILCGVATGFAANFIVALVLWFTPVNGLWISIGVWGGVSIIASLLFYYKRFRPTDVSNARRLDSMGLQERLITMVEYRSSDSYIAKLQRSDAQASLAKVDINRIKIIIPRAIVICFAIFTFLGVGMTTLSVLSERGILPDGNEIIDSLTEVEETKVVVSYEIEDGGVIEGDEEQIIILGTDCTPVTAVADEGFVFKGWSDGYTSPTRTDRGIEEDVTFIAIFMELDDGGDGEGEDGDGEATDEPQDKPSSEEDGNSDSNNQSSPNPDGGNNGGGSADPNNLIINNSDYYRDVIERLNEETSERLDENEDSLTQDEIDMIKKYLGIV